MKKIKDQDKIVYSNNENKIEVKITRVWPMVKIDNRDYDLITFVLNDLERSENGILCTISIEDIEIDKILKKYNFKELFTTYSIDFNYNSIDLSAFNTSNQITKEVSDYFNHKFKIKINYEIPYQHIKNGFIQYQSFYDSNNKIIGIISYYIENNILSIKDVLSDDKAVMKYMIEYILNKHQTNAIIDCLPNEKILSEIIKVLTGKFVTKNYRRFNEK